MGDTTLLLVDDERPLLGLLKRFLERGGYNVHVAETGRQAMELIDSNAAGFGVAVLDLGLPDIPGEQILEHLMRQSPGVKVLISSGTPFGTERLPPEWQPRVAALLKPYLPQELLDAVDALSGGKPAPEA
jgi:DNA-binding response OmpR family regulator